MAIVNDTRQVVKIGVIGIGSAGLAQLKQLIDAFDRPDVRDTKRLELVGYEIRDNVGGIWNHDPTPEPFVKAHLDQNGQDRTLIYPAKDSSPTAVYDGLTATLPGILMSYRGYPFPQETPLFPKSGQVCKYMQDYATDTGLRPYIRFSTRVERLYKDSTAPQPWKVESFGPDGRRFDSFDHVSICNGHYNDPWVPTMPGLSTFPGQVVHSKAYRRASDYAGNNVLVVGSFSSGNDIVRLLGCLNINLYDGTGTPLPGVKPPYGYTKVYQSTTGIPNSSAANDPDEPWQPYITRIPLIDHFEAPSSEHPKGLIYFKDGSQLDEVDVVIFATGYSNSLPFCKSTDAPWKGLRILEEEIKHDERVGGDSWEVGGLRGLVMKGLDELLLFLEGDRSIAFPGLPYQIVPFPFAEAQSRLVAYLWANLLPDFPAHPAPPPNTANAFYTPPLTPPTDGDLAQGGKSIQSPKIRLSVKQRKEFIFPNPYEWDYTQYVFDLLSPAQGDNVEDYWKTVEPWRRQMRADTGLRKRTLGY